ncbi:MAG: SWIM zinc finger family protein [Desulfobacterales bacterium]|jgi:hypothetical protein|nr:SWIM zinc finger family protein [Desulfobacterales bacterium]
MNFFIAVLVLIAIASFFLGSKPKSTQPRRAKPKTKNLEPHFRTHEANSKQDFGDYVRFTSQETIGPDTIGTLTADISKQGDSRIKIKVIAVEGLCCEEDNYEYVYDIKKKKWDDGMYPFEYRSPTGFLKELMETWEEFNGLLPERKHREPITSVDATITETQIPQYDIDKLKKLPKSIKVTGSKGNEYVVDLSQLSCTCPDFVERRAGFPVTDFRRCCKHISKTIIGEKINTKITRENIIKAFIRKASLDDKGVPVFNKMLHIQINEKIRGTRSFYIIIDKSKSPWVDIIDFTALTYMKCGYNFDENRFAYGQSPFPDGSKTKCSLAIQEAVLQYI